MSPLSLIVVGLFAGALSAASALGDTLIAEKNAYVYTQSPTHSPSANTQIEVAARGLTYNRKIYLGFDLSQLAGLQEDQSYSNASLTLTLTGTPLIGLPPSSSSYDLPLELYAIIDGEGAFSSPSWNTAPKNDTASNGAFLTEGVVSLGIANVFIDKNSGTTLANTQVTWSGSAIDNLLNWSTGALGDFYGSGITSATHITLMIGSNGDTGRVGFNFHSLLGAGANDAFKPHLTYETVPEPGTVSLILLAGALGGVCLRRRSLK